MPANKTEALIHAALLERLGPNARVLEVPRDAAHIPDHFVSVGVDHGREGGDRTALCVMKRSDDGPYLELEELIPIPARDYITPEMRNRDDWGPLGWRGCALQRLRGARGRKRALLQRRAVEGRY